MLGRSRPSQVATEWFNRGIEHLREGKFDEALKCFDEATKIHSAYPEAWLSKGFAFRGLGRFKEVLECYKKATETDPNYVEAWLNRGFALRAIARFEEALECFDEVIKKDPGNADAWAGKGFALDKLNRVGEAGRCYDEALRLNPSHGWVKERRRTLEGEFEKKLPNPPVSLQLNENAIRWYDKGHTLAGLGRFDEAAKCYDEAIKIEPSYAQSWYSKGVALHTLGKFEEAAKSYDEAVRIDPSFGLAVEGKGLAEKKLERKLPRIETALHETVFKTNLWKQTSLMMRNTGEIPVRKIKIHFLRRVEVGGLKDVENLNPGEERGLTFSLKPLEPGEVPVEVRVTCKDGEEREYAATETIMFRVLGGKSRKDLTPSTQQTQRIEFSLQPWITVDKCIVCNLILKKGDDIVRCPSCGNKAHEKHMLEWLHLKKTCPACHMQISETALKEISKEESENFQVK